jgi:hypothetical protein
VAACGAPLIPESRFIAETWPHLRAVVPRRSLLYKSSKRVKAIKAIKDLKAGRDDPLPRQDVATTT